MMALASAARSGSAAAFGWVRATGSGPVRVIAAGKGMSAGEEDTGAADPAGPVPLAYPAGATGRPLPPGELTAALTALPYWMPVAITPDALLAGIQEGTGPLEDGLRAWRQPFGWLVLAAPVSKERRQELITEASLAQVMADRHDSPRAKQSAIRSRARHDELKQAATIGLWDIWLLAAAATPAGASRVAGLLCGSLDLRGLPFGLTEQDQCATLPELLGAPPRTEPAAAPGPLMQEVLGMYAGTQPDPGHHQAHSGGPAGYDPGVPAAGYPGPGGTYQGARPGPRSDPAPGRAGARRREQAASSLTTAGFPPGRRTRLPGRAPPGGGSPGPAQGSRRRDAQRPATGHAISPTPGRRFRVPRPRGCSRPWPCRPCGRSPGSG
jgi:hypothetical protein